MKRLIPTLLCDFYKIGHKNQYPENTELVYSNWTPRSNRHLPAAKKSVVFGMQGFIKKYMVDYFNENFFGRPKAEIVAEYCRYLMYTLSIAKPDTSHIEALHDLGYLPLSIRSLPEGTKVDFRVPTATIHNTLPEFFWLTNYFETLMSMELWKPATTATLASIYREILDKHAIATTGSTDGVEFQAHDFSMRGMSGLEDAASAGSGHLLSFVGTDIIPAIQNLENYYNADITEELVGCSVNATEHSVMCAGGQSDEYETYRRLIEDVYPTGILSIVSDTWDLWKVMTEILPRLKDSILARDGGPDSIDKIVIRPDSGDPLLILCGDPTAAEGSPAKAGVVQLLWDLFGGTTNSLGFKVLDPAIGAIYGDSITPDLCNAICSRLATQGFASLNVVFGIGSYTYQYITRDSLGFAMKATLTSANGVETQIFKDPATDDGTKKSAKGGVIVFKGKLIDGLTLAQANSPTTDNDLQLVFEDGEVKATTTLAEIRGRLKGKVKG